MKFSNKIPKNYHQLNQYQSKLWKYEIIILINGMEFDKAWVDFSFDFHKLFCVYTSPNFESWFCPWLCMGVLICPRIRQVVQLQSYWLGISSWKSKRFLLGMSNFISKGTLYSQFKNSTQIGLNSIKISISNLIEQN